MLFYTLIFSVLSGIEFGAKNRSKQIHQHSLDPFDPTTHRWNACAHYARRRRYAAALYAHLNRLLLDLFPEAPHL